MWMTQRLRLTKEQREDNAKLLKLFGEQLNFLFQVHQHVTDLSANMSETRDSKETLALQLSKL